MMVRIALHEFRYHLGAWQTLVLAGLLFGLAFLFTANGVEFEATARGGNVHVNSPYLIANVLAMSSFFALFLAPSFVANAVLRDVGCKFDGILFSTPLRKRDYLPGRFLGGFAALMLVLAAAPMGLLSGTFWPWAMAETLGPNDVAPYLFAYFGLVMPAVFTISSLVFAAAVLSRSLLLSYLVAIGILILYLAASVSETIGDLWDPLLIGSLTERTRYWTAAERNTLIPFQSGNLLWNTLLWTGFSLAALAIAYVRFAFKQPVSKGRSKPDNSGPQVELVVDVSAASTLVPDWQGRPHLRQLIYRTRFEVLSVVHSGPFLFLMALSFFLLFFALTGRETIYHVNTYPVTRAMLGAIQQALTFALMGVLAFYSADLIWRERSCRFSDIIDALPVPNWVFVVSKLVALALVMHVIVLLGILVAISLQLFSGFHDIQPSLYFGRGLVYYTMAYVNLAVLTCFLQVLTCHRLLGIVTFVVFIALISLSRDILGVEDMLLSYGLPGIDAPLSDMNGEGRFALAGWSARIYWAAIAGFMLLATYRLWNRGTSQPLRQRLGAMRHSTVRGFARPTVLLAVALIASASWIFYNTHVLNRYRTLASVEQLQLAYEQKYRQFEDMPMPRIVDVKIDVDLYPERRRVEARATEILENRTDQDIRTIHLSFPIGVEVFDVSLQGAVERSVDSELAYWIFDLAAPMRPGEQRRLSFQSLIQQKGFVHARPDIRLVRNGSFISDHQLTPYVGFNAGNMIKDRNARRDHGLEPLPRMPALDDLAARQDNYLRQDSDFIGFEATVSTVADQIAIAPGTLIRDWAADGRHYFTYRMDAPIMNFFSFLSARYAVARDRWRDVDIAVFHDSQHAYNVRRMLDSAKDSLDIYTDAFGPYQYKQLRIVEFPAYRTFAQSFPGTIPFSEGIGFIADLSDPQQIDLPYYVTAHEIAHQWWAHQVMSANVQGSTLLTETLAQYSALLVMEKKYGPHHLRQFLKAELDRYLSGRADDAEGELPLALVEDQSYIHYRKGALVMYALKDHIGEEAINRALRRLLKEHAFRAAPYAVSSDLVGYLKDEAGAGYRSLIEDFFEKITLYDLRLDAARVTELVDGRYKVVLDVRALKFLADALGNETPASFDLPVDIGLFSKSPADTDFTDDDVIALDKRRIDATTPRVEFIVDRKPLFAGIDPYSKLIDRDADDNLGAVESDNRRRTEAHSAQQEAAATR
jgi:ABC-2 type transport system permease protein